MESVPKQSQNPPSQHPSPTVSNSAVVVSKPSSSKQPVMQSFHSQKRGVSGGIVFLVLLIMIVVGIGCGYGASVVSAKIGTSLVPAVLNPNAPVKGKTYGSSDVSAFKDTTEGVLQNGGIDGEGEYHIVRSGGASQNVYVTSSTVDLSQFLGQKIKVWGQTQAGEKAGWLMDVGRVQEE